MLKIASQANVKLPQTGHRYSEEFKKLCLYIFLTSGRLAYETLCANMANALSSLSTLYRTLNAFDRYVEGELQFVKLKECLNRRNYPLRVFVSEDQTAIVKRPRYDPKSNQLVGFLNETSTVTGFPLRNMNKINSLIDINNIVKNGILSHNAYVFMVQPLVDGSPAFCLSIFGSDNRFSSDDVLRRWRCIEESAKFEGIIVERFASDGDTRCLKAMKTVAHLPITCATETELLCPYLPYFQLLAPPNEEEEVLVTAMSQDVSDESSETMSRGNVKSDSNIRFNDSQTWQDAIIIQDGSITVEASSDAVTPSEHSLTSEQGPETEEYFDSPITSPADSETSQKIQRLRLKRNATRHETRKRKSEDIDTLIATCTSIGKNMNNLLQEEEQNLNKGNYHFLMSMLESMSTLPDNSQNITSCLEALHILPKQIVPAHIVQSVTVEEKFGLYSNINYLPLELFDNEELDSRTPKNWIQHGIIDGVRHPIPGEAYLPVCMKPTVPDTSVDYLNHVYKWVNVAVTDYTPENKLWHVLTLDGYQRTFKVPRIYLMFKAEDPFMFAQRIKEAIELRNETENNIRYEFYLDCMLLTGTPELDEDSLNHVYKLATQNKAIKMDNPEVLEKLEYEVRLNHKRALGEMQFRYSAEKQPQVYRFLNLKPRPVPAVPKKGMVSTGMEDFQARAEYFKWMCIWVIPETHRGMTSVVKYCMDVSAMSLFTTSYGKFVTLEEFEDIQSRATDNHINYLKTSWLGNIAKNIKVCLGDVGKGWFNVNEKHPDIYDTAKLIRFMEVVKYRMQHALRLLVENTTQMFINIVEVPCQCSLHIPDDYKWDSNFIDSPFKPLTQPVFYLQLKMEPEIGAFYSTSPEGFIDALLNLYDNAVRLTHTINQVHPCLLPHLKYPSNIYLSSVGLLDKDVQALETELYTDIKAIIPLKTYCAEYHVHTELFNLNVDTFIREYCEEQHSALEYKDAISLQLKFRDNLDATLPNCIILGPFHVNVEPLKTFLIGKRQEMANKLLDTFCGIMKACMEEVIQEFKYLYVKLNEKPVSIENIYEIRDWMETIPMTVKTQEELTKKYLLEYDVLDFFWYALPQEDFENKWDCIGWPQKLSLQIENANRNLDEEFDKYYKIQQMDECALEERIENFTVQVTNLSNFRDFSRTHEVALEIKRLWKQMREAQEQGQLLNQRQKLFLFEPYRNLWVTASDWLKWHEIWMDNPLVNVDGEGIENIVSDMYKSMIKSARVFADIEAVQSVALEIKRQIDEFKPLIPLIQTLRNPGMRPRHWELLKAETGIAVSWTPTITFNDFISLGITNYPEAVAKIGDTAGKEFAIEQVLDKMLKEWEHNVMELSLYKQTGTYIMKVADDISQMLDDHIVLTQQLSFSPYKGAFTERIDDWETKLRTSSEVLEEWMEVQRAWMYLEPIFTSPDITQQLPVESKKYSTMERTWRRIMRNTYDCPQIIITCSDKKLLDSLKDCNHLLEVVTKGLTDYLEMKRSVFPRLFFLSDDELLEILSQARNPLAVQPHLRKCFENVAKLTFEDDLKISQMWSAEDECIDLRPTLYPTGNVEDWLLVVEKNMKNTIRVTYGESLIDMENCDRKEWVLRWPGQIVIAGCQTYWTSGVEDALNRNDLPVFFEVVLSNLDQLRELVRGQLTYLHREILSALIVIEVHARDVTQILVDNKVCNSNDFDWISQLRYYWVEEDLKVRAVNAEFQYGYEYLGNSGRLVITPLTDRCYLTLTGALHLKFGGAPAGPAGTGKTETTKDLAKAMAIQCVVFNCSDQLDFMAMGKFFKGLASSGAWACFDEFNRIDIEVLSVVAQQIMTIQKAQQAKLDSFFFEGVEIALKLSCAVFITMNPGYAGRTELPDNLKALFRPVAMMVPNYGLIAEISLFSFGFGNAKQLANKITTTFKLSSEQLSSQDHYDFGMRAVKTVIAVAGNLKRERPKMDERQIVLRALMDVNVPKFLKDDLKLFYGISSDLFPNMKEETVDYGLLEEFIRKTIIKHGMEDVDEYVIKVIQLYETTVVRHGLMLVGPTGSGKTKCYEVLKDAMTSLKGKPTPGGYPFQPVNTYVLNPKSITMGQLYGEFDLQTHEWTDGILPSLVRIGVSATTKDKCWYVFDGPVDAVWIENMNTVLDDNKKLCLSSGEIIKLRDTQTMMFEVADLAVASPATVSRCGMVYLEPGVLGLPPFLNCWLNRLPPLAVPYKEILNDMFYIYLLPGIELLRSSLREILTSIDSALVMSFLYLMDFRLGPLAGKDNKPPPPPPFLALLPNLIVPWFIWCFIWSIGATCDNNGRVYLDQWIKEKMKENEHGPAFPSVGFVYDYKLHDGGFTDPTDDNEPAPPTWRNWMEKTEAFKITVDTKYSDIEIPTIDNIRNAELVGIILNNEHNVLCVGPTGTGKTLTVAGKLARNMPKKFICDFINFSARTSANQTQVYKILDLIDSKLDRRRKGIFGPPVLKRQVFFIDDFNMPALEVYGAQPPIELIRQWMDFSGWYDRRNVGEFRTIIDINFAAAMGPPGGGRNPITPRLLRHFHYIAFTELEDNSKVKIFGTILQFWIDRTQGLNIFFEPLLFSSLDVYSTILKELLPTPAKTHYTFNLRDLSKVIQGVLMKTPEPISALSDLLLLWYHECCRVFQDRLINDQDRNWFDNLLRTIISTKFEVNADEYLGNDVILFGDFLDPTSDQRPYVQITDMEKLSNALDFYLYEYNCQTTRPMRLVLFLDAISHVSRIARIIRQPMGNALLLGMGGSGRQSLTRLATHMAEYICFQIELTKTYGNSEWREDVKTLMLKAGLYKRETVFLFSDTQIKSESFLEDLNNVLNSGDVPNIYQIEELDKIFQGMKGIVTEMGLAATKSNLFSVYQKQVRANLHTVITMSPIGEIFRARLRQFPALVNCCTIDWFSAWPNSALQSVALQFLEEIEELEVTNEVLNGIVVVCQFMHASVVDASELFLQELSRHNYVTPTSYLELLSSYSNLMGKKKGSLSAGVGRLKTGLDKLETTTLEINILQKDLEKMKPLLEIAAKDAEVMIAQIAADTVLFYEALPALAAAEESLKALNKNDITEVKGMKKPPVGVIYVIEAICICKGIKPNKVPGEKLGEKVLDYWEPGRNMLSDPGAFMASLLNYDKESITEEMITKLKVYVENPLFTPQKIAQVSKACMSLCTWVHAMYKFYFVNQSVAPKKAALAGAKEELEITEKILAVAKEKMRVVMAGLQNLSDQLNSKIAFKEEKERSITLCQERMHRAIRLIGGLGDEKDRWIQTIETIEANTINVTGDILICSGSVAYLTPFTDKYRRGLFSEWLLVLEDQKVPHSLKCDPVTILGEPVVIRQWQLDGLPRDYLSTENAVLVSCSKRWPLFIDPQGQANKWIKNMGKAKGISICKLADRDLIRTLESAIRFGKSVLIENVGTELDPALDPVLLRQIFRQGNAWVLKLGDVTVPYNDEFELYMTTTLPNPHYTPETSIKVLLVNFTLVPSGLQDQLLGLVVMQERPDLEELRSQLVISNAQMKAELKEIQDRILHKLSVSEGSPVDDIEFIITLEASKVKSDDIKSKVEAAEITQIDIDNTRAQYIPVANRGQILFFCLSDLSSVDPMYQYSLEWYVNIFVGSMAETEKAETLAERVFIINEYLTFSLYSNVCRSLFEKHKLLFAFLLSIRILMDEKIVDPHEWHFFLAGGSVLRELDNPAPEWLSTKAWNEILAMENLPVFQGYPDTFPSTLSYYKRIFESAEPHKEELPALIESKLSNFQKMFILKALRPDKVTNGMQDFITNHLGRRFVEPQATDLSAMFKESSPITPLIFVLSTGTDPAADLYKFADKMKFAKRLFSISLGQGQGPRAEKLIESAIDVGSWVFFQNCHLAPSWMPRLERVIETLNPDAIHREFRLWLTSTPSPYFPVSILQNSAKMTVEPPRGVKATMMRAYLNQVSDLHEFFHSDHEKVPTFKWLLFSLCLFHGILLERRKFGPLGFNIPYEFTDGDLKICISQLHMFLLEYSDIPFKVLVYTTGHINYGGRVTDDWDRRCLMNILAEYYDQKVVSEEYSFDETGRYHQQKPETTLNEYLDYIKRLPLNDEPQLFGLHSNADISCAQAYTYQCLNTLLLLQPKQVGGAAASQEEVTSNMALGILEVLPKRFNLGKISEKYPVSYGESLNTVLGQEAIRYNKLLVIIESTLRDLLKALKGLVVMSETLEKMTGSLFSNMVPAIWASKAYPSLKPLGAWVTDLIARVKFMDTWVNDGIPASFWISGFYFPQAFLTGTMQNFARKNVLSIDTIGFGYKVIKERPQTRQDMGAVIYGLFVEGCRWNMSTMTLDESNPKELYTDMPPIWFIPEENHKQPGNIYECPVYKTLTRAGTLSTTGHSTNYVVAIEIPTARGGRHWIKRGVALFCALNY
ncbi:hypothetical protein RN001_003643 [Aquatica leii]|uniref:Dynein heavy chain 1, axonemal n=1 Tax=Aquatica leii TaxID=1421715 RepID=A0AAN7SKW8_9COLE|nr:hypothetical protein RN001_003643 [Aquatica leii]